MLCSLCSNLELFFMQLAHPFCAGSVDCHVNFSLVKVLIDLEDST